MVLIIFPKKIWLLKHFSCLSPAVPISPYLDPDCTGYSVTLPLQILLFNQRRLIPLFNSLLWVQAQFIAMGTFAELIVVDTFLQPPVVDAFVQPFVMDTLDQPMHYDLFYCSIHCVWTFPINLFWRIQPIVTTPCWRLSYVRVEIGGFYPGSHGETNLKLVLASFSLVFFPDNNLVIVPQGK